MHTAGRFVFVAALAAAIIDTTQSQFIDVESFDPTFMEQGADRSEMITLRTKIHFYNDVYDHIYVREEMWIYIGFIFFWTEYF